MENYAGVDSLFIAATICLFNQSLYLVVQHFDGAFDN
jgi:hypothetical protein